MSNAKCVQVFIEPGFLLQLKNKSFEKTHVQTALKQWLSISMLWHPGMTCNPFKGAAEFPIVLIGVQTPTQDSQDKQ